MWQLVIRSSSLQTRQVDLKDGVNTLGRLSTSDIVIDDAAASRTHAEIITDEKTGTISVTDLNSTNGTYVNRDMVSGMAFLKDGDVIRIGQVLMAVQQIRQDNNTISAPVGTHLYTRELVLESLDQHAVLLYEVARKLNMVQDIAAAIFQVTEMIKKAMNVDNCVIIPRSQFMTINTRGFTPGLARKAIQNRSAEVTATEMFIPVISGEDTLAIICMSKSNAGTRPFDRRDLQLAIAISHQTALTLQRMELLERVRREENIQRLLMRFVSPSEAEFLLKDYASAGHLPELSEQKVTVLFADIAESTRMAEKLGAFHFSQLLNSFYEDAAEITFKYKGMIKYLGDGVLSIFPEKSAPNSEEKAVMAAQELISRLNQTGSLEPGRKVVIGAAINTGTAMVGYVGIQERAEFNVLGDVVNVAYRMQEYARPYKIIVGPATVAAINEKFKFKRVGAVRLKGREHEIQAYEVLF